MAKLSTSEKIAKAIARTDAAIARHGADSKQARRAQSKVDDLYIDLAGEEDRATHDGLSEGECYEALSRDAS